VRPERYWLGGSAWFGGLVAAIGTALAVYLFVRMGES
jgi:hypothetical protein